MFAAKVHGLFPPKISDQQLLQKQLSRKNSPSPRRRVIDQKVLDYFHTERTRKDVILEDWLKPIAELFVDLLRAMFRWSSWRRLIEKLKRIDDAEEHDHLFTVKHGLMGLVALILVLVLGNVCWMTLWFWQSAALNAILRQQNDIMEQQTRIFAELALLLNEQHVMNQGELLNES